MMVGNSAATDILLDIRGLRVEFDTEAGVLVAVDGVSLAMRRGETLGLVGESGCGKSVTAMSVLRLVPSPPGRIAGGEIVFGGEDLLRMPIERLRKVRGAEIGMIFQDPMTALSPLSRIGDQLAESVRLHKAMSAGAAFELAGEWLEKVGVPEPRRRLREYPHQLSGGMQQRVMIASALMPGPRLLIADEPTTALDVTLQRQILDLMRRVISAEAGLLLITHDMGVVRKMCDRVAVMYAGELVELASAKDLFKCPAHPYTEALLAAIPGRTERGKPLPTIPGSVPSAGEMPSGCRFAPRCAYAEEKCRALRPPLEAVAGGGRDGLTRCFFPERILAKTPERV